MKDWRLHIESDPKKLFGKPVFKGTRIPVDLLLEKLSEGESIDELLSAYPNLTREAVLSALAFAAERVKNEIVHSIAS